MRTQERIVERVKIAHQLLFSGERKDYTFMCVELMWAVLKEKYTFREKSPFQIRDDGEMTLFDFLPEGETEKSRGELSKYIYNEWSVLLYARYNNNLKKYTLHGKSIPKAALPAWMGKSPSSRSPAREAVFGRVWGFAGIIGQPTAGNRFARRCVPVAAEKAATHCQGTVNAEGKTAPNRLVFACDLVAG